MDFGLLADTPPTLADFAGRLSRVIRARVLLIVRDDEGSGLKFGAISDVQDGRYAHEVIDRLNRIYVPLYDDLQNYDDDPTLETLATVAGLAVHHAVPMSAGQTLIGLMLVEMTDSLFANELEMGFLRLLASSAAAALYNSRLHRQTVQRLADHVYQLGMMQQIDRELNDTIALDTVFSITLDWALRFTRADAGMIAFYQQDVDLPRVVFHYGYPFPEAQLKTLREQPTGITHRVIRAGQAELIPDVSADPMYAVIPLAVRSQLAVPVMREDQVVAVLTLDSTRLNNFTEVHQTFVLNLAARAAVAIDNARLYAESVREREKLASILASIADVVIALDIEGRVLILNQSARAALQVRPEMHSVGQPFDEVVAYRPLLDLFSLAQEDREPQSEELVLPNERTFYTKIRFHEGIGWIIVMQDVSPYKEMDKLRSDLIAAVSHDLKQPLSVMRGYLDLLQMKNTFTDQSMSWIGMVERSILKMRQLIDDLLDMARIESGIELDFELVDLHPLLSECIDANLPAAEIKDQRLTLDVSANLPRIQGDRSRLGQIFNNLISNALKYTPGGGQIAVMVDRRGKMLRVAVKDNGLGISPEDQAHIFERFYRVRRPETHAIEGTGLGLAIVKSLVDAHRGRIRLESALGEGSTFFVTLPAASETE